MIQIIGKGGFAKEVGGYTNCKKVFVENEGVDNLPRYYGTLIAIGDGKVREAIALKHKHLKWTGINKGTFFGMVTFGDGVIICPGTVLTTDIVIGDHVIINLNCTVGHDTIIGDFTTVSPGANISGNVTIGKRCYIGTNAVIREKITICDDVTIGAGGVVVKDITEPGTYVGNPVKKLG